MTPSMKVGIAGIVLGLILLAVLPWWAAVGIIIIAAAIPVGGYMALDKSQRRRLKAIRFRRDEQPRAGDSRVLSGRRGAGLRRDRGCDQARHGRR